MLSQISATESKIKLQHSGWLPFYLRLTHSEWVSTVRGLTGAETKVYHIQALTPSAMPLALREAQDATANPFANRGGEC